MNVWPDLSHSGKRVGYARVSTPAQKLNMQLDALNAIGCQPIYSDHGVSGAKASRTGLDDALRVLEAGDVLVVFKLDRLGRSVLHLADLLTWFDREDIHFCSLAEGINTTTPGGKLVYHVFSAVAEFQRDMIRENTLAGLEAARQRGKRLGRRYALDEQAVLGAHAQIMQDGVAVAEMARRLDVSYATMVRALRRLGLSTAIA